MSNTINPLNVSSYTNKDFQSIYVELLEAAKMLAKNWDPTISNESDPGVVLLKLNAIIADKNNYNIDKNVLENYPETYTQSMSARSQYRQLGYRMPWYRAAVTNISVKYIGEKLAESESITIPKYTLISDADEDYVYTTLEDISLGYADGEYTDEVFVKAIQGTMTQFKLAGSDVITLSNLDERNRVYIGDMSIAENGIYVVNSDDSLQGKWEQVENVDVQSAGTKCYEFDIDPIKNLPYLQFPSDIRTLIGSGLNIKYIATSGSMGNIAAKTLSKFYSLSSVNVDYLGESRKISVDADTFRVYNTTGTHDGRDPETVEEAYTSYRKVVGTFNTLVTLRDYMNAIYNSGLVSNVVVTDRTNDIQCTYRIVDKTGSSLPGYVRYTTTKLSEEYTTDINEAEDANAPYDLIIGGGNTKPVYKKLHRSTEEISAFELKMYLLKNGDLLNRDLEKTELNYIDSYNTSFEVDNSSSTRNSVETVLEESKSVQHNFVDIKPDIPFMLQNEYPIKLKIIPTYKLTEVQKREVKENITIALIELLNASKCEFGMEPDYDTIYNAIASSDNRIKVVIMDDFKYITYAVYAETSDEGLEFKYIPISDYTNCSYIIHSNSYTSLDTRAKSIISRENSCDGYLFIDDTNSIIYKYDNSSKKLEQYSDKLKDIRKHIIAKNILAGVTPIFEPDDKGFLTTMEMNQITSMSGKFSSMSTELKICPFGEGAEYTDDSSRTATYELRENENLRFMAPSFISDKTFANYVKFEMCLKNPLMDSEKFVYADPADAQDIIARLGYNHFYTKENATTYTKAVSAAYEKLSGEPAFDPITMYQKVGSGSTVTYRPITSGLKRVEGNPSYEGAAPAFMSGCYYYKNNDQYELCTKYQYQNDSGRIVCWGQGASESGERNGFNYENYFRLLPYCEGYARLSDFSGSREGIIQEMSIDQKVYTYTSGRHTVFKNLSKIDMTEIAEEQNLYVLVNLSDLPFNSFTYHVADGYTLFEPVASTEQPVYVEITDSDGHVRGYRHATNADSGKTKYTFDKESVVNLNNYSFRKVESNFSITGVGNCTTSVPTPEVIYDMPSAYSYTNNIYSIITLDSTILDNWVNNYNTYYKKIDTFDGLHPSSNEYASWLSKSSTYYVPDIVYSIPKDTEYQFREGDYIAFFWRESNDEDAPYTYEKYGLWYDEDIGLPTIIKPNFTLKATPITEARFNDLPEGGGSIVWSADSNSHFQKAFALYGDNDLAGTRSIEMRKMNTVKLDSENRKYYYFANNDVDKIGNTEYFNMKLDYYDHTFDSGSSGPCVVRYRHILQASEYFMYTNSDRTLFEALGEGTLIEYRKKYESLPTNYNDQLHLTVQYVDSTKIMFEGITAFSELCNEVVGEDVVILIEEQIYSFVHGDKVQFTLKDDIGSSYEQASDGDYKLDEVYKNVEVSVSGGNVIKPGFIPNYYYHKEGEGVYTLLYEEPSDWRTQELGEDGKATYGCTKYFQLQKREYVAAPDGYTGTRYRKVLPTYPEIGTTPFFLDNKYRVAYSTVNNNGGNSSYVPLPALNVSDPMYDWSVTSHLNISLGNKKPQKICRKNSSLTSKQIVDINEVSNMNDDDDVYILASIPVSKAGGNNIDISYQSLAGTRENPCLYTYKKNKEFIKAIDANSNVVNVDYEILSDGVLVVTLDNTADITKTIYIDNLKLNNEYNHILPIEIYDDNAILEVRYCNRNISNPIQSAVGGLHISCLCCDGIGNGFYGPGKHFFVIPKEEIKDDAVLRIDYQTIGDSPVLRIDPMFRYLERDIFGADGEIPKYGITTGEILETVKDLDKPNKFDYTYLPESEKSISDPLDPVSMFSSNHVYNKFTIARAAIDTREPSDASVEFVNNR